MQGNGNITLSAWKSELRERFYIFDNLFHFFLKYVKFVLLYIL